VKDPAKGLGQNIRWIDNSRDVFEDNVANSTPMLEAKVTDLDVAGSVSGTTMIHNLDRGVVVLINGSGGGLSISQLSEDKAKVLGDLGCGVGCYQFSFSGALSGNRLGLGAVCNSTASKTAAIASGRSALTEFIAMSSICEGKKLEEGIRCWDGWQRGVRDNA